MSAPREAARRTAVPTSGTRPGGPFWDVTVTSVVTRGRRAPRTGTCSRGPCGAGRAPTWRVHEGDVVPVLQAPPVHQHRGYLLCPPVQLHTRQRVRYRALRAGEQRSQVPLRSSAGHPLRRRAGHSQTWTAGGAGASTAVPLVSVRAPSPPQGPDRRLSPSPSPLARSTARRDI